MYYIEKKERGEKRKKELKIYIILKTFFLDISTKSVSMQSYLFDSNSQPRSMCNLVMAIQPIIQYKAIISYNSVRPKRCIMFIFSFLYFL